MKAYAFIQAQIHPSPVSEDCRSLNISKESGFKHKVDGKNICFIALERRVCEKLTMWAAISSFDHPRGATI
jgi:hypothetical protein